MVFRRLMLGRLIDSGCFVGYGCCIEPGCCIESGCRIEFDGRSDFEGCDLSPQAIEHGAILKGAGVTFYLFTSCEGSENPTHNLAATGFG